MEIQPDLGFFDLLSVSRPDFLLDDSTSSGFAHHAPPRIFLGEEVLCEVRSPRFGRRCCGCWIRWSDGSPSTGADGGNRTRRSTLMAAAASGDRAAFTATAFNHG